MSTDILPPTTAGIYPEKFTGSPFFSSGRKWGFIALAIAMIIGFTLRVGQLGAESLAEDELNKLETVAEYRAHGLSSKNGEHPFLMKGLQTVSFTLAEKWNAMAGPSTMISDEAALRFPIALFCTFSCLLIFLLVSELFGRGIGLISAVLYAVEPMAVGFDRIAKEDSLALFFLLLTGWFMLKSQTAAQRGNPNWMRYMLACGAAFAGLMASKYYPHLLSIVGAYYVIFVGIPGNNWNLGKVRWLKFMMVMGLAFLILNPTIMLPETWREMFKFSSENRIGHDSYEFMGQLYPNHLTAWLRGVPWTFYYVFVAVKTSLVTLILFAIGLPLMFRRSLGDGRYLIFFWAFMWLLPFSVLGGKFTRYFAVAEPLVLITAAVGAYFTIKWLSDKLALKPPMTTAFATAALVLITSSILANSLAVGPHYRMFTNLIGGGMAAAGSHFPHDEFYDASTREVSNAIVQAASPGSTIASETPALYQYYVRKAGRDDLKTISLSDPQSVATLRPGDFIVLVRGRRYVSNGRYEEILESTPTVAEFKILGVTSAKLYLPDEATLARLQSSN